MKKKKNKLIMLAITMLLVLFNNSKNVEASTQKVTLTDTGWWWAYSYNGTYKSWHWYAYDFNGRPAFCINPQTDEGEEYFTGDWSYSNLSNDKKEKMLLLAHYGYDYPGHNSLQYRAATQALLWEEAGSTPVHFSERRYEHGLYNIDAEKNEILRLVNNHYVKPSFNNISIDMQVGESITLTDANGVLSNYEVFDSNGAELTISGNNLIIKSNKVGKLNLKFRKKQYTNLNYIVYYNGDAQRMLSAGVVDPVYSNLNINSVGGKVTLNKIDKETGLSVGQGNAELKGAVYAIYKENDTKVGELTIGEDGTATSDFLPDLGRYYLKEIKAGTGYELDPNKYYFSVSIDNLSPEVTVQEQVIKGKIKILKVDNSTNSCKASGQGQLKGAVYEVFNSSGNVVDTLIIGDDCSAISKLLPYGLYKIKEKKASNGYQIDTNIYTVNINSTATLEVISKEKIITNFINILKQYGFVEGNSTILNAESNITFEIYYPDGKKFSEITTDKNGYACIEIPFGIWKFHQTNTYNGLAKIHDFFITVDENSEKTHYYNILNNKLSSYLQVIKIDQETGKKIAISGVTFKILNTDTNTYVSQFVGGKVYDTFKTDETGSFTTYLKLEAGNYRLIEVSEPNGYLISTTGLDFTIGDNSDYYYTNYGPIIVVKFPNTAIKGKVEINKKGEKFVIENGTYIYKWIPLEGIHFSVVAAEDIMSPDKQHLYYKKGELVERLITDKNGYAISKDLPLGKYFLIETKSLDDYVIDNNIYSFTLSSKDNKTAIVYQHYDLLNYLSKGKLEFIKTDLVNDEAIANTIVEIYTEKDELIYTGKTDENGKIIISDLKVGKYYILEKEPSTGYLLNDEKIYFEVKENNEIVKAKMTNKKITSKVKIHKVDENNNPLEGVIIGVYDLNGNLIFSDITDKNGDIEVTLEYGSYYWQEIASKDGYKLSNEKIYFDVKEEGEIIQKTLVNELKEIEVPDTLANSYFYLLPLGCLLIGSIMIIVTRKNKKN